ncbi:hypothetical protein L195_g011499, partial [Trifolium pratense]
VTTRDGVSPKTFSKWLPGQGN